MSESSIIVRYGAPSKYDESPYGTLCKSITTLGEELEIYAQVSLNSASPQWEWVGSFPRLISDERIQEEADKIINK